MIIKKEKKGNVTIFTVDKDFNDEEMARRMNTKLRRCDVPNIISSDADVYTTDGKLLLRYRRGALSTRNIDTFYDNVIELAKKKTTNRGSASGSEIKSNWTNPVIQTNIFGYFDKLNPKHKLVMKANNIAKPLAVRETWFVRNRPEKYKKAIPLIREIDRHYKRLLPKQYALQKKKANATPFRIADTAFTTITLNLNWQTFVHTDKGDDAEGMGNLAVIERGKYEGGETCFPQYGVGVDVRTGDALYMDVHQPHGNLPIKLLTKDAQRLSIVSYLRMKIYEKTKGMTKAEMRTHLDNLNSCLEEGKCSRFRTQRRKVTVNSTRKRRNGS